MCAYLSSKYESPHWACFLRCCEKCSRIDLPSPESNQHNYVENFIKNKMIEKSTVLCIKKKLENLSYADVLKGENL